MKHLKTYENIIEDELYNTILKKYILIHFWKNDSDTINYYVLRTIKKPTLEKIYYDKYYYYDKNSKLQEQDEKTPHSYRNITGVMKILYQSNNLKNALKTLEMIENTNKYNI